MTFKGGSENSVVNLGTIEAIDGDVFLIARSVENHGAITASKGTVGLAAGTEVILQPAGEESIGVSVASRSGKVVNTGTIVAAQAELKAAGGNLYALAIRNSGTIRATGVERKGGRVLLRANNGTIENVGRIAAKNANGTGGKVVLGRARNAVATRTKAKTPVRVVNRGKIEASGTVGGVVAISADDVFLSDSSQLLALGNVGAGGAISIEAGGDIELGSGSFADVSGGSGGILAVSAGGTIGGSGNFLARGESGGGGEIRVNSVAAHLAQATNLAADGAAGGGVIKLVAQGRMEFHGTLSARGLAPGANGGSAEVSGFASLVYDGTADLSGNAGSTGRLLLDPTNFTIDAPTAATIVSNLATASVVIATSSAGSGAGDIFINAPILYSSGNNLSLLAHRNIFANSSVQSGGAGAVNLVAGWNGITGNDGYFETILSAPASYGNNGGSIFVGEGSQGDAIAVGSRLGATNVAAFGLSVSGSDRGNSASAQLGYQPVSAGVTATGPIRVFLQGDLSIAGGGANFAYAQIGHGGGSSSGSFDAPISIVTPGDLRMLGGANFSYAQIGHGGEGSSGSQFGSITVRTANLDITGGSRPHANAQIGHGDASGGAFGFRTGTIDILATGETSLVNGPGNNAIWFIGHGTQTAGGLSNASVAFTTGTLDYSSAVVATQATLSQDFADKFTRSLSGGDVTIRASGIGGMVTQGAFTYSSPNSLTLISDRNAVIGGSIVNSGSGAIQIVIDNANPAKPGLNASASLTITPGVQLQGGGAVRLFAVDPAHTQLGNFTPVQQRYGVWFGDPAAVAGVNYKFQPTLTLTANSLAKAYGDVITFNGTEYSVSGLQPGDVLSQILTGDPVLLSSGSGATAGVAGGPYAINFGPGLGTNFGYGLQLISGALTVNPAPLTIAALNQSKVYGNVLSFAGAELATTGLRNGELIGLADLASAGAVGTATVGGSPYAITIANARGGTFDPANYTISYAPGLLSVTPAPLTITAANRTKGYGDVLTFAGTEFTATGLRNSDAVASVTLTSLGSAATAAVVGSPYAIDLGNAVGSGLGNYAISYVPGALAVTPAALTLTAQNRSKVYGSALAFAGTEFNAVGLKNGEIVGMVDLASAGSSPTATVAGAPYAVTIANARGGSFSASNYAITYVPGSLSVTQAALTIRANDRSKVYGDFVVFAGSEFTSVGLLNADAISSVSLSSVGAGAAAGVSGSPYLINIGNAVGTGLGNYSISYVPGALSVTPAALTLTALNRTKVYGSTVTFAGTEFSASGLKNGETVGLVDLNSAGASPVSTVTGSPYVITIGNARGGSFTPSNYAISYAPAALTLTPAALTVTAANRAKLYGDTVVFAGSEFTSSGLLNADSISSVGLSSAGTAAAAGVTGSPYPIAIGNAVGSGLGNYSIAYVPGSLVVSPAPLTITALDQTKVYGDTRTFAGTEFDASGLRNGELVGLVTLSSVGSIPTVSVPGSPYAITASNARAGTFNPANYAITYVSGSLAVTPAVLTLTANNQSKVYGNVFTFAGTEFGPAGLTNGETVGVVDLASAGAAAGASIAGSPYPISIGNARGGTFNPANYTITYVPGAFSVAQAALTIAAVDQSKVYGKTFTFAGTEFTVVGLQPGDSVASVSLSSLGGAPTAGVAGSPYTISVGNATGVGIGNYAISYVPGAFSVTPAPLTLSAIDQTKAYGDALNFAGTEFGSIGLKNGETVGMVDLASIGVGPTATVAGSPYAITIGNARGGTFNASNYAITYESAALAVTTVALTITASNQTKIYGDAFAFAGTEFTSVGLRNSDSIASVTLTSSATSLTAGVLGAPYVINVGSAVGTGLGNYTINYAPGSFAVTPAPLTLTASNQSKVYGATLNFTGTEFTSAGLKNGETVGLVDLFSAGAAATAPVAGSPYTITIGNARGGTFTASNYAVSYVPGALNVTPTALTVTAIDQSKTYGSAFSFSGTEFTSVGLLNGDAISSVFLNSPGSAETANVSGSPYAISISNAIGNGLANYTISYVAGLLSVTPAPLTITAKNQTKVYGDLLTLVGTEFTSAGLVNGDSISSVSLSSVGAGGAAGVAASPYGIGIANAQGSGLGNYTINYVPGSLAIAPAPLTLTALSQQKVYGSSLIFTGAEFAAAGLKNGETIGAVDLTSPGAIPAAGVAAGPYQIAIANPHGGTFDPANYAIGFAEGALDVTPASLVITALNQSKRQGISFIFAGTEFKAVGLQNGETIGSVLLSSLGARSDAVVGSYAIPAAAASGGTFDAENYNVTYAPGEFAVLAPPPPPPPPPQPPPTVVPPPVTPPRPPGYSLDELTKLLDTIQQSNQTTVQNTEADDAPTEITGFGIQRITLNPFFGEQLIEPGGAMMIDATGLGPLLPIAEAPGDLEKELEENPHAALEEAIAEDDQRAPRSSSTRYYDVDAGQIFKATDSGRSGFEDLSRGPAVLRHATDLQIEMILLPAATR